MRLKPETCKGCSLYGSGEGFVGDLLDKRAEVLVIGMFPSTYEVRTGQPQIGMTVDDYKKNYERFAGRAHTSYANVVRCRGNMGDKLPTGKRLKDAVQTCRQYDRIPEATKLVVFVGKDVPRHLRPDVKSADDWRGFILPERESNDHERNDLHDHAE